jgi:threonyl-tRNA synthetase
LINFWRDEHRKAGYQEISTPQILDKKLWQISGHWEKYRDNIFLTKYEDRDFAVKPMNCPGGMLVFKTTQKSYKNLPLRVAELGVVHRQELSGVLAGLFRVIKFTQDDAHIFCNEEQLESEIKGVIALVEKFYKKFGFSYRVELSTRPEKRIGEEKLWDKAEKVLEDVLKKTKLKYKLNKGEGAFYGPKIDFHIKDSLGREWQCATIQLDFAMPERFELEYIGADNKPHRPIMLHRAIYGSLERFIGILLEHLNGNLPVWLSPIQARVLSFTDRNIKASEKVLLALKEVGIRADADFDSTTVNDKVRSAEMMRIPYIIVIGDKEEKAKTLAVRERGKKDVKFGVKADKFIAELKDKIDKRT